MGGVLPGAEVILVVTSAGGSGMGGSATVKGGVWLAGTIELGPEGAASSTSSSEVNGLGCTPSSDPHGVSRVVRR